MNVTCPECSTTYRVDPAKVPAEGILAQCERCPATFRVAAETTGDEFEAGSAGAGPVAAGFGEDSLEPRIGHASGGILEAADALHDAGAGYSEESHRISPEVDERTAAPEGLPVSGEESSRETEPGDDSYQRYAGASDVAFHTEGAEPEDLPYLEPAAGAPSRSPVETDLPLISTASAAPDGPSDEEPPATAEQEQEQEQDPPAEDSTSPGEAALPPAPFGARSDPHRRAARLARALVSDIVVYHPERRTRSLRQGTLRQEFREEIRKSWEEYANQVGGDFARQTTYFRDALNEILAEGTTVF